MLKKVIESFDKACESYDRVATIQKQSAAFLVEKLNMNIRPRTILDLGTGTGFMPEQLLSLYPESEYFLNDSSQQMLNVAKRKFTANHNFNYIFGDMREINFDNFDLIVSNLAFQWLDDLYKMIRCGYDKSCHAFGFSTLLNGTFDGWRDLISIYQPIQDNHYPLKEELVCSCEKITSHFKYWTVDIPLSFKNPTSMMIYLRELGATASLNDIRPSTIKSLIKLEQPVTVLYKVFFGIFTK